MAETALRIKVEGAKRLQEALKDPKLLKGPIADFLKKSMNYVIGSAMEKAPVDTGRLRASIPLSSEVRETEATIGSNVVYAPYVEFGTKRMKAQPFLVPALQGAKSAIDGFLKEAINKIEAFWERK